MKNTRVNEIDLLRFMAVLAVVFFHYAFRGYAGDARSVMAYPLLASVSKYGYLGVELFFMISGFVILMTASSGSLRKFFVSRAVRLYPAFWVCCTITFLVIRAIGAPRYSASIGQYLANLTLMNGFVGIPPIDDVYWSLYVELQFYALVCIVLALGRIHHAQRLLVLWLAATIVLEIFPIGVLRDFLITKFAAFFIAGAAFYLIWSKGLSLPRIALVITAWGLAVFQSIKELKGIEDHYSTPMNKYIVAGIITAFFVVMLLVALQRTGVIGRRRWLLLGALTYPVFLLHQNIGFMLFNVGYPTLSPHFLFWGTIAAAIAAGYLVHILVEKRCAAPMKGALNEFADWLKHLTMRRSEPAESGVEIER